MRATQRQSRTWLAASLVAAVAFASATGFSADAGARPVARAQSTSGQPSDGIPGPDSDAVTQTAREALVGVYTEAAALHALGAFATGSEPIASLIDAVGLPAGVSRADRQLTLDTLRGADAAGRNHVATMAAVQPPVSFLTMYTVGPLPPGEMEAVRVGEAVIDSSRYLAALEHLLHRNGRPPIPGAEVDIDPVALAEELRARLNLTPATPRGELSTSGPASSGPGTPAALVTTTLATTAAPATTTTATSSTATTTAGADSAAVSTIDSAIEPMAVPAPATPVAPTVALITLAFVAVGGVLAAMRRRRPQERAAKVERADATSLKGVLEASRRLSAAERREDVERTAVEQAVALTGGEAGAFLRYDAGVLAVGYTTDANLLVASRLGDGALGRVVDAGVELVQVVQADPALATAPLSVLAAPVFASGAVTGALLIVRAAARPFRDADRLVLTELRPVVGAAYDAARRAEAALEGALVDALTGVGNRRRLDVALADACDIPLSLIMIDFDHFKAVNDLHGHQAGDDLLAAGAHLVQQNIRPVDRLFRYGGEEFCVLVPEADESVAVSVAERVRSALAAQRFTLGPDRVAHRVTASFGVAAGLGGEALIASADRALYAAKQSGRNRVVRAGSLV